MIPGSVPGVGEVPGLFHAIVVIPLVFALVTGALFTRESQQVEAEYDSDEGETGVTRRQRIGNETMQRLIRSPLFLVAFLGFDLSLVAGVLLTDLSAVTVVLNYAVGGATGVLVGTVAGTTR